ncbi:MAG: hypothetical protein PHQ50_06010 [Eubacteriales bacterium]|nr:hypothetical protein [Eubacteriales bacterium]
MSCMVAFHGVDSKIGTTMLCQSVAEWIAKEKKDHRVLLVSLNGREGSEYTDKAGASMESLKIFLDNRLLSRKELLESSKKSANFHLIAGVSDSRQARHFAPEAAVYFLDSVEDDFDVILVDTGNELDNGLAIGALERIKNRVLVISQQETMLRRYEIQKPLYKKLGFSFERTLVNKYQKEDPYDLSYISKRLSVSENELFQISESGEARQAEVVHKTLLSFKDSKYKEEIEQTAKAIIGNHAMTKKVEVKRKKWISFI